MDLFIPDKSSLENACAKVSHLGIGAHQDDLEFMAMHGILHCYQKTTQYFGGITCTDGRGSPRSGRYASLSDEEMVAVRYQEQRTAAEIGEYALIAQLGYSSSVIRENVKPLVEDLYQFLSQMQPKVIYTHNPLDKHVTHQAVFCAVIEALRRLPQAQRPEKLLGCEVWRGLDWLPEDEKISLDVSTHPELCKRLVRVFDSQIAGGKRYDQAVLGRYQANATFSNADHVDEASLISYAMDLTPLIEEESRDIKEFALGFIDRFRNQVAEGNNEKLSRFILK